MGQPVALFDIDHTLYNGWLFFDVLQAQKTNGLYNKEGLAELEHAFVAYKKQQLGYEAAMSKILYEHAKTVAGQSSEKLLDLAKKVCEQHKANIYPYVADILALFRPSHDIVLVSGEPQYIARAFAETINVDYFFSSRYETKDNRFTGEVEQALAFRHEKQEAIAALLADHPKEDSFAFGDAAGDIAMLESVEHAICLHPSEELADIATQNNWYIATDKNVVSLVKGLKR